MRLSVYFTWFFFILYLHVNAQNTPIKGINFQGVARNIDGSVIPSRNITVRLTIRESNENGTIEYQEIKSVTTNIVGIFSLVLGSSENLNIVVSGSYDNINWLSGYKYLQVEIDPTNSINFISLGDKKINYVPYALVAASVEKNNVIGLGLALNSKLNTLDTAIMLANYMKAGDYIKSSALNGTDSFNLILKGNLQISPGNVKLIDDNTALLAPRIIGTLTGNATTANKFALPRNINGVPFDGSSDISINTNAETLIGSILASNVTSSSLTNVGTITTGTWSATEIDIAHGGTGATNANDAKVNFGLGNIENTALSTWDGSANIKTIGTLVAGAIPYSLLTGTAPTWNQNTTGNAATATTAGNITATANTSLTTLSNLTSVGTITTGTWSATEIDIAHGGTGATNANDAKVNFGLGNIENTALSKWDGSANIKTIGTLVAGAIPYSLLTGTAPTWNQNTTGNAATATTAGNITATANTSLTTLSNLTSVGTITTGTWSATEIDIAHGGTGATNANDAKVNFGLGNIENTALSTWDGSANIKTIGTLVAGAIPYSLLTGTAPTWNQNTTGNAATATTAGNITATANTSLTTLSNLTSVGTITTGTWSATEIDIAHGGTGATNANDAKVNFGLGNIENTALSTWDGSANIKTIGTLVAGAIPYSLLTGTAPTWNQNTTGNAATATTAGNITATANTSLTTLSNLTSVGTITTGTWSATEIDIAHGGTGASTLSGILVGPSIPGAPISSAAYGSFFDLTDQITTAINTPIPMSFNSTDFANGVSVETNGINLTRIKVANKGKYNIQFSAQLGRVTGTTLETISIWLRKNELDVAASCTDIVFQGTAAASDRVAAWNFFQDLNANDYIEIMWSSTNLNLLIDFQDSRSLPTRPAIPSVILTVNQVY